MGNDVAAGMNQAKDLSGKSGAVMYLKVKLRYSSASLGATALPSGPSKNNWDA